MAKSPASEFRGFQITTVGEQIARAHAGHVTKWLVEGVLVKGGSTLFYAPSGNGKSLIAMDLAIAASEGRRWLGVHDLGQPIPVLYLDDDGNNDCEFNSRLLAFGAQETNPNLHCLLHNGFQVTDACHRRELIAWCKRQHIQLLIIDSLTRIHRKAESSADEMKLVNSCIKEFCQAGITVFMLHHADKVGKTYRGSSEIKTAYDGVFRLEKMGDGLFTMKNEKVRSVGKNGVWQGCDIAVTTSENGSLVLDGSLPMSGDEADEGSGKTAPVRLQEEVLRLIGQEDMHTTALKQALKLSSRDYPALDTCLEGLLAEGTLDTYKKGKATYYRLVGGEDTDSADPSTGDVNDEIAA